MADDDTTTASADAATDQSSSEADGAATDPQKVIEELRLRQSGADKAKNLAIAERDALQKQLDALLSGKPASKDDSPKDEAAIRAEVQREYDERLAKERAADLAKVLDAQFPEARKRFPEVTDAVKLTELETLFASPAKPIGNNAQRPAGGEKRIEDMSVAELRVSLDKQAAGLLNPKS